MPSQKLRFKRWLLPPGTPDPYKLANKARLQAHKEARREKARIIRTKDAVKKQKTQKIKTLRQLIAFDAIQRYSDRRQREFNKLAELETWNRAPRNLDEVQSMLTMMAKRVGLVYGGFLSVGRRGDDLIFVDATGEDVVDPGGVDNPATSILCATAQEIDSGEFLKLFAARSLYAALTTRFNVLDRGGEALAAGDSVRQ
jgi:hypothetical protein